MTASPDGEPLRPGAGPELGALIAAAPAAERDELAAIAGRLADRPLPRPAVRAEIRAAVSAAKPAARPANLRRLVAAYLCSGAFLLGLAAAGLSGAGPLGG